MHLECFSSNWNVEMVETIVQTMTTQHLKVFTLSHNDTTSIFFVLGGCRPKTPCNKLRGRRPLGEIVRLGGKFYFNFVSLRTLRETLA